MSTKVGLGPANGLDGPCAASCDIVITIEKAALGRRVGLAFEPQEHELTAAIISTFALLTG